MRKNDWQGQLRHLRIVKLSLLVSLSILLAATFASPQRRRKQSVQRTIPRASNDYSRFSHLTTKHQQKCTTCHHVPTKGWQTVSDYPDITDYPGHDACVSCHRPQFFRGAAPVICSVCHIKIGPRADARLNFRRHRSSSQFAIEFPHDQHQDVIASIQLLNTSIFRQISFRSGDNDVYNNCTICHSSSTASPSSSTHWPDGYVPDSLTFKSTPTSHSSCFNCHWKSQAPVKDSCDGCHRLSETKVISAEAPNRISLKFRHEGGGEKRNHVAECVTCHINITKSSTVRALKPDVPITACSECHNKDGLRLDVSTELAKVDKDRGFVCLYCHTSDVGKRNPPPSHYLIAEREPLSLRNSK